VLQNKCTLKKTHSIISWLSNILLAGILLSIGILLTGCKDSPLKDNRPAREITFALHPFETMSQHDVSDVYSALIKIYPSVKINESIKLPNGAWYAPRSRYRADSLIKYLSNKTPASHITIGLTSKDISTAKAGFADWGVIGLGYCPGKACVVSTYRLAGKDIASQLYKLCLHEWGHTLGLPHCAVSTCFMRDAEGKNPFNEETGFCNNCKAKLVVKGWHLN